MTVGLLAVHGFLGQATDWDGLAERLPGVSLGALDLWTVLADHGVRDWASAVAAVDVALQQETERLFHPSARRAGAGGATPDAGVGPVFVVGYSLGARLVLGSHWLAGAAPVRGCCLVSCNPGLADADESGREERRLADETWARRILDEPEHAFWRAWDAQPVFAGSLPPAPRSVLPAPRVELARALTACSLGVQPDLRARLRACPVPVLWVTGSRDTKFSAIARELRGAGTAARFDSCPTAGHRVPWDDGEWFAGVLRGWMSQVMENER